MSESIDNLCRDLMGAYSALPDVDKAYERLASVFSRTIEYALKGVSLVFAGTFAKVDYLLKEHHASSSLCRCVNAARRRLRFRGAQSNDISADTLTADVAAVARFINLIFVDETPDFLRSIIADIGKCEEASVPRSRHIAEYLRAVVKAWDATFVYCHIDDEEFLAADAPTFARGKDEDVVKVIYAGQIGLYKFDWSYLHPLWREGAQINIVRPRLTKNYIEPELLIYEPDDLVNISSIAACFTNYAESPVVDLLSRIKPRQNTEAIMLGNFAGQLLDEVIHQEDSVSYKDSVAAFFKANALKLINADITPQFHPAAQLQKQNIEKAMRRALPESVDNFDSKEGLVEPSFFCEMLGLQGRMDFLQSDFKVLIEQKSGKGRYPYGDFTTPVQKEDHYVQLLLYMLVIRYNFNDIYEQNNRSLQAFLLYSKYSESLLKLDIAPALVHRALKVRNELAHSHLMQATEDGCRLLERLTPETINVKCDSSSLWELYQRPGFLRLLAPIHRASALERGYYFRFLSFLSAEFYAAKTGSNDRPCSGFSSIWHDPLPEKLKSGNIYCRLSLDPAIFNSKTKIDKLTLDFAGDTDNDMSNFRPGDIVILYPYGKDSLPDARRRMVHRCSIECVGQNSIVLSLRFAQSDGRAFRGGANQYWAIEHDFMESAFSPLYRGLHAFLSASKDRRDLLMLQREPRVDSSRRLSGSYGEFDPLMLRVKQAEDMFIIIGPPGTGKTSFGMLNTLKEELLSPSASALILSYTNRAVDEICSKLEAEHIDYVRIGSAISCAPEYRKHLLGTRVEGMAKLDQIRSMIASTRVVVATTAAVNSNMAIFDLRKFSVAIIDEASQILEPHLIGVLSAAYKNRPAIDKFVLIGDHKQLPAVVQQSTEISVVGDPALRAIGLVDCRLSLFERLLLRYENDPKVVYMLTRQGRMHRDIARFPNAAFYDGLLTEAGMPHQNGALPPCSPSDDIKWAVKGRRVAFVDVEAADKDVSDKINLDEAAVIADMLIEIYEEEDDFDVNATVGVIVPYRNQIAAIRSEVARRGYPGLCEISIDTVERYQGSQRKFIIYGFTVRRFYQLAFLTSNTFVDGHGNEIDRKLNVAMTRAKEHLIMVGNAGLLSQVPLFARLIDFVRSDNGLVKINS